MSQRLERINQLLRAEISDILLRDLHDPLIGFVTITGVEVSPDLHFARVFFSVLGDPEQVRASTKGLLRARKYINARVAERVELRFIPKLRFQLDDTAARAQQMAELLRAEHLQHGDAPAPAPPVTEAASRAADDLAPGATDDLEDEDFDDELAEDELDDEHFADQDLEDDDLEDEDFGDDEPEEAK
jgi:ribosome-binding factor A